MLDTIRLGSANRAAAVLPSYVLVNLMSNATRDCGDPRVFLNEDCSNRNDFYFRFCLYQSRTEKREGTNRGIRAAGL